MNEIYALITGLLLRIGIPILLTGGLVYLLSQMDARWQKQAMQQQAPKASTEQLPCWVQKGCSPGQKVAACPASKSTEPCWQVFRQSNGYLAEKCLDCEVFRNAPALTPAQN